MADFVQLEQQLLAHDLQRAHLLGVLLLSQKDLAVATLTDLGEDLEVTLAKSHPSLAEISSFPTGILVPHLVVGVIISRGGRRELLFEGIEAVLAIASVGEEVKVVVEEVCQENILVNGACSFWLNTGLTYKAE